MPPNLPPWALSRRQFVRVTAASAGALATSGLVGCRDAPIASPDLDAAFKRGGNGNGNGGGNGGPGGPRNSLYIPDSIRANDGIITLDAAPAQVDVGGGQSSSVWAYNGSLPGPTIVANRGDRVQVHLINSLPDESITHWHGMIIDEPNDGHPRFAVPGDGGTFDYDFVVDQRSCLNWYHPHPHGRTGQQVNLGLAGAFIIRDNGEESGLPAGPPYEVPLIIRDVKFGKSGGITYRPKRSGYEGDTAMVNGTVNAGLEVDTAVYRFRILNGANARIFRLALGDRTTPFLLIGNDGGLLEAAEDVYEITMSPAERVDVLVDLRGASVGDTLMLRDLNAGWDLLELSVTNAVNDESSLPTTFAGIPALGVPARTTEFAFEGMSRINGQEFSMNRSDYSIPRGQVEEWIFTTAGNAPHPVHVHASPFQIIDRTGGRGVLYPWERGWKDTVLLEDGETVRVLVHFPDSRQVGGPDLQGRYLVHCHKLEHEDAGMMMNLDIT